MTVLEICVDSLESAIAAEAGGAQRVELCTALAEGGLTPSLGLLRAVRSRIAIDIHVMVRPRAGDFLYSSDDFALMKSEIAIARENGANGIVLGLLTADGDIDVERTAKLVELAHPMKVTFHRAIDLTRDIESALEDVIRTGAHLVLTSGGEPTAMQGRNFIRKMMLTAGDRIQIMAGGGIRPDNICEIARATGALEYHSALRRSVSSNIRHQRHKVHLGDLGIDDYTYKVVKAADVKVLREALDTAFTTEAPVGANDLRNA